MIILWYLTAFSLTLLSEVSALLLHIMKMAIILVELLDSYIQLEKQLETLNLLDASLYLMVEAARQKENEFIKIIKETEQTKLNCEDMIITILHWNKNKNQCDINLVV